MGGENSKKLGSSREFFSSRRSSVSSGSRSSSNTKAAPERTYEMPRQQLAIAGQACDKSDPIYQYALYCITELTKAYLDGDHPHQLGDKYYGRYREALEDLKQDLDFEELPTANFQFDGEWDVKTKSAIVDVAQIYLRSSPVHGQSLDGTETLQQLVEVVDHSTIKYYYTESLKILICDMQRKECFDITIASRNQKFREFVKRKDLHAWLKLKEQFPNLESSILLHEQTMLLKRSTSAVMKQPTPLPSRPRSNTLTAVDSRRPRPEFLLVEPPRHCRGKSVSPNPQRRDRNLVEKPK